MSLTFPNSTLTSLPKTNSDHTPIQLTLSTSIPKPNFFRFENCWLRDPGFLLAILPAWNDNSQGCAAASLVRSLKMVRSASKTWARGKRTPPSLHSNCKFVIYLFDLLEQGRLLAAGEQLLRAQCREQLALSLRERAAYLKQRGKFRAIREDDSNTRFFHARANQRLRQNQIRVLEVDGVTVASHTDKTAALTAHLKELLREPAPLLPASDLPAMLYSGNMVMDPEMLMAPFTQDEAFAAVKAMNRNSSPGPDGFGPSFYKASWETVAPTVMRFVHAFYDEIADLECANCSFVVVLPKHQTAARPSDFRPICLQNCPMKIVSKMLTTRLQREIPKIIDIDQTGFIKGRSISENFVYAMELVQCCHRRKLPTLVLKLDFVKAFDSVKWSSLNAVMSA
jgi:hypothetical protein